MPQHTRKKRRRPHHTLTHFEVRRDKRLLLKITIANSALPRIGPELGKLLAGVAHTPHAPTPNLGLEAEIEEEVDLSPETAELVISPQHDDDDEPYHAAVRQHMMGLFSILCDASLADALHIVQEERARRIAESN